MRASREVYENVAEKCSEFRAYRKKDMLSNLMGEGYNTSCLNCKHFSENEYCKLDLFDKIIEDH